MATVTGLTKERMLEIEAASVVSGMIDAAGHLILTRHDGTTVDAGYALVAVPDASDTQKGVVELATEIETAAHTDATRAVTPASLAPTMLRLDTLEAKPGDKVQIISPIPPESAGPSAYPTGISVTIVSASDTNIWSLNGNTGTVTTVNVNSNRLYQLFMATSGGPSALAKMWVRTHHDPEGWTPWAQMATPDDSSTMGMTGEIKIWPSSTIPNGWRLCDGGAINRITYSKLFSILNTTYGVGDGSTTFNVPDLKGRVPTGFDGTQGEFNVMGKTGGAKTHTLTTAEMPSHTHTDSGHLHAPGPGGAFWTTGPSANVANGTFWGLHTFDGSNNTTAYASANIQNTGGGGAHNNLPPYITLRYIIKL